MPSLENFLLFVAASVVLVITPGPNMIYLVSRTLCQGRAAGLVSLAGVQLGFVVHVLAAALGLSAVFLVVPVAYDALRYAGAAYLLWLAWDALKPGSVGMFAPRPLPLDPPARLFRQGLLTSILNPKVALFYLSLFPQFISPERGNVLGQGLVLGGAQVVLSVIGDGAMVLTAGALARWLANRPLWLVAQRWVFGLVLIAIALRLVVDERGQKAGS